MRKRQVIWGLRHSSFSFTRLKIFIARQKTMLLDNDFQRHFKPELFLLQNKLRQ